MKFFLFAAFALSLILAVSAQTESECNVREVQGCITAYTERLKGATTPEITQRTKEFCVSACVTVTLSACTSLSSNLQAGVDEIKEGCSQLPNGVAASFDYSVIALLSSVILVGMELAAAF